MIDITIEFKRTGDETWQSLRVGEDDYFWSDPDEPGEKWDIDSVPEHSHPIYYLPSPHDDIRLVRLTVENKDTKMKRRHLYEHWHGPESFLCAAMDDGTGNTPCGELILASPMPHLPNGSQVVRIDLSGPQPRLSMNVLMHGKNGDEFTIDLRKKKDCPDKVPPQAGWKRIDRVSETSE